MSKIALMNSNWQFFTMEITTLFKSVQICSLSHIRVIGKKLTLINLNKNMFILTILMFLTSDRHFGQSSRSISTKIKN
jgi:hypothetical protein